jgi:excinuclease ABC subunit B
MSEKFVLKSDYKPSGDQPEAIAGLIQGVQDGERFQTLLGATGTGKTFTIANVIQAVQKPTLIIAHNKTLAAQLCNEFRRFFPENAVEYFVSYYDYYQPEAYIARSDTYIEKEAQINQEIDRLRHAATQSVLTRKDVIIVATVSCIYGLGSPKEYENTVMHLKAGEDFDREKVLQRLVDMQFTRTQTDLTRGTFRLRGTLLEVMPVNEEFVYRIDATRGFIEHIDRQDPVSKAFESKINDLWLFPAKHFITATKEREEALVKIRQELKERLEYFEKNGKLLEAERLERKTKYDLELLETLGYCNGVENYSQPLSGRAPGEPPDTLFEYFPEDCLIVIDESHVTVPQLGGMYEGDRSRKQSLIEHGFRLPSAADNRPLQFHELEKKMKKTIFVSATPGKYERENSSRIAEQIIRPTGLVDPEVVLLPVTPGEYEAGDLPIELPFAIPSPYEGQVHDLLNNRIPEVIARGERILVTTLTKKMSEDLTTFMTERGLKVRYLHSGIETVERLEILSEFRKGTYDIIVGVNLLREGLDLPEVSLVAIMDADKEGFLRSETSLIQTIGRAARNVRGRVLLYADNMTGSLDRAIKETERRRAKQVAYNIKHKITPKTIIKAIDDLREILGLSASEKDIKEILKLELTADSHALGDIIKQKEKEMKEAAKNLEFELAAILRDEINQLDNELRKRNRESALPDKEKKNVEKKGRHGRTR